MNFNQILSHVPNLNECKVLDVFAREGDWQTHELVSKVKSIEAWEIGLEFIEALKKNLPDAKVFCRDSIKFINENDYTKFDLVIIDNGLNLYGSNKQYCEHFDFIHNLGHVLKEECFVIFNVVLQPFNYHMFPDWEERRNSFYGIEDTSNISKSFFKKYYKDLFNSIGFETINYHSVCREYHGEIDYLYYVGMQLKKIK